MQKTDARGVVSTYGYDALNRNTSVVYTNDPAGTPAVHRYYDGWRDGNFTNIPYVKGRLWQTETSGANGSRTTTNSFDALGRPLSQSQQFYAGSQWSQSFTAQRAYNLANGVTSQTYPSGHTVTYNYDAAGRLGDKDAQNLAFTGNLGDGVARTYSRGIIYSPMGGMTKEQFGTDIPIYNKLFYNSRGQLSEIRESTSYAGPTDTTWNRGAIINHYSNNCWGMCGGSNSSASMTDNNGNLKKQEVYIPLNDQASSYTTWWQGYDYDVLNRLQRVHEYTGNPVVDWQQEYVYDRYGNRTIQQTNSWGAGINKKDFTANAANNNRLGVPSGQTGTMTYDNAGNLTNDTYTSAGSRTYDAENRMTSAGTAGVSPAVYTYNADGQRVRRTIDGVETWQVYGFDGELLAEYAANTSYTTPQKEYGYRNGQLLITATVGSGLAANGSASAGSAGILPAGVSAAHAVRADALNADKMSALPGKDLLALNHSIELPAWLGRLTSKEGPESISDTSMPLFSPSFSAASFGSLGLAAPQSTATKIAFASNRDGSGQIYLMNTDGTGQSRLTNNSTNDESPQWSPDNSRLVFQSDRDNPFCGLMDIYVMNADGSGQTRLTSDAADDSAPVWSPDGTHLAFQSARNAVNYQVYVMNTDGSGQVNISNSTANDIQPSWSPDGTKIAFASDRDHSGTAAIYVMNANGSNQIRLTFGSAPFRDEQPVWSPDGVKIAFVSTRDSIVETWQETDDEGGILVRTRVRSNKEVYLMNADGSSPVRLTNTLENDDSPAWSVDGTKIVFRSDRERECCDPVAQVWVMNADGTSQVNLSNNEVGDYGPAWQGLATTNLPPSVSITIPANGASFNAPANITITASASDSDGTISRVDFYQGTSLLGTDTTAPYSVDWNNVAAGSHTLTAKATDNIGATTDSSPINVTVNLPPPPVADIQWLVSDQLGTPRMIFDQTGALATTKRHDYLPFGEELFAGQGARTTALGYSGDNVRQKFTQKERDNETGLDFFEARYYGNAQGRFTSPDPLSGHTEDPQTLNRYAYVRNNPQRFTDPTGLDFYLTCDGDSATCQNGRLGQTDKKGNFTATMISNDKNGGLVDQYGNTYATQITGQGVSFSGAGCDEFIQGVFLNGTNATTIQASGSLTGFTFNFTMSNLSADQTAAGTFSFNGTSEQTRQALENAGYHNYGLDDANIFHFGMEDFRSHGGKKGDGSGHFAVDSFEAVPVPDMGYERVRRTTVPTTGNEHFGETNPWVSLKALKKHAGQVKRAILP